MLIDTHTHVIATDTNTNTNTSTSTRRYPLAPLHRFGVQRTMYDQPQIGT
jgi:hypothetical protein